MKEHLHGVKTHSSKLQSFLEVHQIEQEVHQCLRYVEGIEDDDRVKEFEIKLKQNDEINNTISKLESLESLGEVFVDKTRIRMKRESSVRRGAQVQAPEQSNINNMTMNIETKIRINMEKKENMIGDMICLMDGRVIIVVENLGKVHILTADGKLQKKLSIPGLNANEIRFIDLEGTTLISIPVQSESLLSSFVHYNDRVIYADYTGSAVYCVDKTGVQIWGYKQDLSEPVGLCTDLYGNIIVTDHGSNRILVISKDGQNSKVLLSEEGGLKYPWRICFKSNESSGFISDYFGKYLTKFNLCSK
ncbi:unnamed protein product [Mytilus edulis]|uniref:Uncharacterized protein n=1 Tax=Mytilus edulis TaxID=6550 RepID=A0A8S3UKJ8_MYTED|nr:unnamed protein product [Mytilus edulis]